MKLRRPFCLAVGGAGGLSVVAKEERACACCDDDDGIFWELLLYFFPVVLKEFPYFTPPFPKTDRERESSFSKFLSLLFQKCH